MRSLDENDDEEICNFFMSTLSQVYDPHSEYFSQSELENFRVNMGNKLVGIGALLSTDDGGAAKIQGIVVGGPADKAGELQINDRIVGVGQGEEGEIVDIMYMKLNKIVDMVRGKKGTVVVLKIIPADAADDSQTRKIFINRDQVMLNSLRYPHPTIPSSESDGSTSMPSTQTCSAARAVAVPTSRNCSAG
jgi:carboxyl-terminal processing protease